MTPVKIIFFDIDGTLVDPRTGCISDKTVYALQQLRTRGFLLGLVTGRPTACLPDLRGLTFDVIATFNGCVCQAGSELIYSNPIDREDVQTVLDNAAALDRPVSIAVKDRLAANGWDPDLADYYTLAHAVLTVAEDFEEVLKEDIYQIMIGCRKEDHAAIVRGTHNVKLAVSWDRAVDVIPLTGGKGSAIRHALAHFHLDPSEAMAFGDSYNDMEMFEAVGTGIAMGNAAERLKVMAKDVCGPVSQDGIYHYLADRGLIGKDETL